MSGCSEDLAKFEAIRELSIRAPLQSLAALGMLWDRQGCLTAYLSKSARELVDVAY